MDNIKVINRNFFIIKNNAYFSEQWVFESARLHDKTLTFTAYYSINNEGEMTCVIPPKDDLVINQTHWE